MAVRTSQTSTRPYTTEWRGQKAEWSKLRGVWDVRMLRQQEATAVREIWKRDSRVT